MSSSIVPRLLITAGLLAGTFVLLHGGIRSERMPIRQPLQALPLALGRWHGIDAPLRQRLVDAAGVDDYANRIYQAAGEQVEMYVGYYASQRTGDLVHSPKNCLPAAGWEPVRVGQLTVAMPTGAPIVINDYLIEKGQDRQLVLYWYQCRGRVIASEYQAKYWMVSDAITRNRTDGALVRIMSSARNGEAEARTRALEFLHVIYPHLKDFLPE